MRRRRRPPRLRALLAALLAVPIAFTAIVATPAVSGDDLSNALAQQRALQTTIRDQQAALVQLKAAEAQLQSALAATSGQLHQVAADQDVLAQRVASATAALQDAQARYVDLVAQVAHLDWTLAILQDELAQGRQDLAARKRLLAQRLAQAYQTQQTSLLEQILSTDSFTTVLSQVGSYLRLGDQDAQLADQISQDQAALLALERTTDAMRWKTDQLRAQVEQQAQQLRQQQADLVAAKQQLDALAAKTKRLQAQQLAAWQQTATTQAQAAKILAQEQAAEQGLANRIDQIIAQQAAFGGIPSQYNGTFQWPMAGVITQPFGCTGFSMEPPLGSCAHFHTGIDIADVAGTPVHAAGAGVVVFVGYNPYDAPPRAYIVVIAHSTTLETWYGHLQPSAVVAAGQNVASGQLIGYEGCTGHCTGPHLHWAVMLNDTWVNPRLFL